MKDTKDKDLPTLCSLGYDQQIAFNALKEAYEKCIKKGILFVNIESDLLAFDKYKIHEVDEEYTDDKQFTSLEMPEDCIQQSQKITIPGMWFGDDTLIMTLTKHGSDIYHKK